MDKGKRKKYIHQLFIVMIALVLVACGNEENNTEPNDVAGDSTDEAIEEVDGTLEIGVGPEYLPFIEEILPQFEEETGVEIVITERELFGLLEALPLDGPANLAPDVMIAPYDRIGGLGQQGHLHPVTLSDDGRYDDTDEQQVTTEDEVYGAPFVIESLVMFYNTDLLDAAPETFEELEALAEDDQYAFESEQGTSTAFLTEWTDFYSSYGLISGYGGYIFGEDGTDTSDIGLNTDGVIEALEYATDWYDTWPEGMQDVTGAMDFLNEQFMSGSAAAVINGPWVAEAYEDRDINYDVTKVPTLPNGNEYQPFGGGKGWVISQYTENARAAQLWLDYVTNEENMLLLHELTNEIPAHQQVQLSIVEADDNPLAIAIVEQYETSVPMPNIPEMAEVWTGAETMMFDAVSENKTPQESADDSVELIINNIEQKY